MTGDAGDESSTQFTNTVGMLPLFSKKEEATQIKFKSIERHFSRYTEPLGVFVEAHVEPFVNLAFELIHIF